MKGKKTTNRMILLFSLLILIFFNLVFPIHVSSADNVYVEFTAGNQYPPNEPELVDPSPSGTTISSENSATLSVWVTDDDGNNVNVSFYSSSHVLLHTNTQVANDSTTSYTWSDLVSGTTYSWYVKVNDTIYENTSDTWSFKTKEATNNNPPPDDPPDDEPILYPPVANISAPKQANISEKVFFIGNKSTDPDGIIVEYKWDFDNDGETDYTTENVNYTFNTTGIHNVTLTVEDDSGLLDSITHQIKIVQYPIAKINTTWGNTGFIDDTKQQKLRFCANESYDPDGTITGYRWDFNIHDNKSWDTEWLNSTVNHFVWNYSKTGNYTIKLQVKDNDNLTSIDFFNITILNTSKELPVPIINTTAIAYLGEKIFFNSSESYDPDGTITRYTWYFGDGNISYEQNPTHIYNKTGIYLVILEATDGDNLTNAEITWINIIEKPQNITTDKPKEKYNAPFTLIIAILSGIAAATLIIIFILTKNKKPLKNPKKTESDIEKQKTSKKTKDKKETKKENTSKHNIKEITKIQGLGSSIVIKLEKAGINNLEELNELTDEELKKIDGIGEKTCKIIRENLPKIIKK